MVCREIIPLAVTENTRTVKYIHVNTPMFLKFTSISAYLVWRCWKLNGRTKISVGAGIVLEDNITLGGSLRTFGCAYVKTNERPLHFRLELDWRRNDVVALVLDRDETQVLVVERST